MCRYGRLLVFSAMVCSLSCGGQEQKAIDTFLGAVQSGDEAARSAVSRVGFDEAFESWNVVEVGPESTEPFRLPELRRTAQEAKSDLDLQDEKNAYFIRDNRDIYERYQAQLQKDPDYQFKGDLAKFHEEWQERSEEQKRLEAELERVTTEMQRERATAAISLMGGSVTDDFEGEVAVREARVNVVHGEGGETPYRFTLRKYNLVNKTTNHSPRSRWIITGILEQGG